MADVDRLKKELEEIKKELAAQIEGSRAYKALTRDKAEVQAQLIGAGALAIGDGATAISKQAIGVDGSVTGSLLNTGGFIKSINLHLTGTTWRKKL